MPGFPVPALALSTPARIPAPALALSTPAKIPVRASSFDLGNRKTKHPNMSVFTGGTDRSHRFRDPARPPGADHRSWAAMGTGMRPCLSGPSTSAANSWQCCRPASWARPTGGRWWPASVVGERPSFDVRPEVDAGLSRQRQLKVGGLVGWCSSRTTPSCAGHSRVVDPDRTQAQTLWLRLRGHVMCIVALVSSRRTDRPMTATSQRSQRLNPERDPEGLNNGHLNKDRGPEPHAGRQEATVEA